VYVWRMHRDGLVNLLLLKGLHYIIGGGPPEIVRTRTICEGPPAEAPLSSKSYSQLPFIL